MSEYEHTVFVSYAWGSEREDIVNQIDETLQARGIKIVRDKRDLGYKGSIKEFMERIGQGNCVIVVISDKYLRSPNCMFELVEIAENKQFHDRVFPIVLSDANIYDPIKRIEYVKYWEAKRAELAKAMKKLDPANLQGIRDDMDQYDRIRDKISGLTSILKDMNTLTPEMHRDSDFNDLYTAIVEHMAGQSPAVSTAESGTIPKKEAEEEASSFGAQKAETSRKEKEKSVRAIPIEINAGTASATPAQKKSVSTGLIVGGATFVIFAILVVINLMSGKNPPTTPIETQPANNASTPTIAPVGVVNISTSEPTSTFAADTAVPTTATLEPQPFFTEEFNSDLSHWSSFVTHGDENRMNVHVDNGKMIFELNDLTSDLYAYYVLNDFTYTDVQLEAVASNHGVNDNNVSLICRYTDSGWYEFNIANNGTYTIFAYDSKGSVAAQGYNGLADGGSQAIKSGQATNTYTATCKGNKLSLSINGTPVRTVVDTQFNFDNGKIGLSVSAFRVLPVNIQFDSLKISKP